MSKSADENDPIRDSEYQHYSKIFDIENDLTILLLRTHLYSESMLERIILLHLPRGDRVIEHGNLTYMQKLVLVDSFNVLEDSIISSMRNLNRIRNECAHELKKQITINDITRIGSPLGKEYSAMKIEAKADIPKLFELLTITISARLAGYCVGFEEAKVNAEKQK